MLHNYSPCYCETPELVLLKREYQIFRFPLKLFITFRDYLSTGTNHCPNFSVQIYMALRDCKIPISLVVPYQSCISVKILFQKPAENV